MLSYPFSWLPVAVVVAVLVLLNAYLALIAFAVFTLLALAVALGLIWLAAVELLALGRRALAAGRRPAQADHLRGTAVR